MRAGIVGCGEMGMHHAALISLNPEVELAAAADVSRERAERLAKAFGVPKVYGDYREMLERERLDMVTIATQLPTHAEVALAAAERGVHVLCEKPLAMDLLEADRMVAAFRRKGLILAVQHQMRLGQAPQAALRLLREGKIGELVAVRAHFGKGRRAGYDIFEMGTHVFDHIRLYAGNPTWCAATISVGGRPAEIEDARPSRELWPGGRDCGLVVGDAMSAAFVFDSGVTAQATSFLMEEALARLDPNAPKLLTGPYEHGTGVELLGTKGALRVYGFWHDQLCYSPDPVWLLSSPPRKWIRMALPEEPPIEVPGVEGVNGRHLVSMKPVVEAMIRSVREGVDHPCSGEDGRTALEMIMAVFESHFSGAPVQLPLERRDHPLVRLQRRLGAAGVS